MSLNFLIVDDSRMSRLILQGLAQQRHPDWTVLQASSGEEALEVASQHAVHLVSMDFNMHGLNGLEAAIELRRRHPGLPVALMTANVQSSVQERAREAGILFLAKPITAVSLEQMAALVDNLAGGRP
ncbi:MAG: response regulator [Hydrogenophaga sp.]|nr:response regulator [Hydrogenophaga sp.]